MRLQLNLLIAITVVIISSLTITLNAAVLPEERADVMYHRYDGGGVTIDGPSILVRKNFADKVSVSANHYVDSISSASIDVKVLASSASRYSEERTERTLSATLLQNKSLISAGITDSDENDYSAKTHFFSISQDFFGDLTNITMGYARGNDEVRQTGRADFEETIDRQNYRLSISQIISPTLLGSFNFETITEEGYLNNPYRQYRFRISDTAAQFEQEQYPDTRTSDAASIALMYYLPYRASIKGEYRYFKDDWEIKASSYQLTYTHPFGQHWLFDIKYRYYDQDKAEFYQDLFNSASQDEKDFRARDKELSTFQSQTLGIGISYQLPAWNSRFIDKSSINLQWDYIKFEYDDFRDLTAEGFAIGAEPLYSFEADVIKLYFSAWY